MPSIGAGNLSVEGHLFPLKHFDNMHLMFFLCKYKATCYKTLYKQYYCVYVQLMQSL